MGELLNQIRKRMLQVPLFWISISAAIGILAVDQHWSWVFVALFLSALLFQKRRSYLTLIAGMSLGCVVFAWIHQDRVAKIKKFPLLASIQANGRIRISGKGWICSDTNRRTGQRVRVVLELSELEVRGRSVPMRNQDRIIALINHPVTPNLGYGSEIRFSGLISEIEMATSPGAFDPAEYFYRSASALAEVDINTGDKCEPTGLSNGFGLKKRAISSRKWMEKALVHGVENDHRDMTGMILAMALGAREKSPDDVEDLFRLSGTMHVFAVSGLHVGVVAGMFWFLLKWMGLSRRSTVFVIIPAVLFYALLTGFRPSSFRAAVMLSVFLAGVALRRKASPVNGIGLAALVLLAVNSQQLFLPGFQLSFCVVLVLSLAASLFSDKIHSPFKIDEFLPRSRVAVWRIFTDHCIRTISILAGVSVASWLGSVVLMDWHFSGISPIGLVANIIMVPVASVIVMIAGVSVFFFGIKLTFVSMLLNHINIFVAAFLTLLAQFFAQLPLAHIHTGHSKIATEDATISLDVMGLRGESAVLATSQNKHWMLDSGGNLTFRRQVLPLLRERGINHLDCLILTHGDSGHIGAAPYLLNHIPPKLVIESALPNRSRVYPEINRIIEARGISRLQVVAGQTLRWSDGIYWEPLFPSKDDPPTGVADDRCLVMRLRAGPWKVLFTFDTGFLVEKQLIEKSSNLGADIWIRGQHSSTKSGSFEFLEKINPRVVISTHAPFPPHEKLSGEWMKRVVNSGAKLITLDEAGSVNIQITPTAILIAPFTNGKTIVIPR